jgi:subtilisin family serine protease
MKYTTPILIALLVCGICIASVSAVPVIVGLKETSHVQAGSSAGITILSGGTSWASSAPDISLGVPTHSFPAIHAVAVDISEEEIANLQASGAVRYVEPDYVVTALGPVMQWNIKQINADDAQAVYINGTGIRVAVIDTGIDYTHPDLAGVYAGGYNVRSPSAGPMDDNGHGTHCAGILAATGSSKGIYGTAPGVSLYAVKVLSDKGDGRVSDLIEGLFWAKNNSMQVASMSLGMSEDSQAMHDAIDEVSAGGVLIVAAAGNSGIASGAGDTMSYPAKYDGVLAVSAVNKYNHRAFWSSTGSKIGVTAPGVNIRSTIPGGKYATYSGTSMATPHVAGVAALVYSVHPDWTNKQVRQQIISTATPLGNSWFYGAGLVNAAAASGVSDDSSTNAAGTGIFPADVGTEEDSLPFSWDQGVAEATA